MATPGVDRYVVIRRAFTYVVSDQQTGEWVKEFRGRDAAHRHADKLNKEGRNNEQARAD